jgi:hypothetical protein
MRRAWSVRVVCALACALALFRSHPAEAQSRTLDWPRFHVSARLDSSGTLHVREAQSMRFTGDWNGGERRFEVGSGQRFSLERVQRVDRATGDTITLEEGNVDLVDHYTLDAGSVLRWRSRLPDDPPFSATEFTYILTYTYGRILQPDGSRFVLDHQFAFRDRDAEIRDFTLHLAIDSAWSVPPDVTGEYFAEVLPVGESFLVTIPLEWKGAEPPGDVWLGTPAALQLPLLGVLAVSLAVMGWVFFRGEVEGQRFAPLVPAEQVNAEWLERHVFSLKAEVVGAAWDDRVGTPEVAATLARMVGEGKLESRVESRGWKRLPRRVLHLTLRVPRSGLSGYEHSLVNALFGLVANRTSTDEVRKRYADCGFNPVDIIESPIRSAVEEIPESGRLLPRASHWRITLVLALMAVVLLFAAGSQRLEDVPIALLCCVFGAAAYLFARLQARVWGTRVVRPGRHALRFLLPLALPAGALSWLITSGAYFMGPLALLCLVLVVLTFTASTLNHARTPYTAERMRFRKRLASAREYFVAELRRPEPRLQDAWYPYLLAFGLGRRVDRWFRAFGGRIATSGSGTSLSDGMGRGFTTASDDGGWRGFSGGGGFAGGGATVAFGAAVGGMAASVSAPPSSSSSSSSSGGGSSSSGGSSGGGGGGGW